MATGTSLTNARSKEVLNCYLRGAAITAPGALYMGLYGAPRWAASTAYALNSFVVATASGNTRLFKATAVSGTGTSGSSEPAWPSTPGGTVVDNAGANQITWTEQTPACDQIADATTAFISELSGNAYARQNLGQTNFATASDVTPTATSTGATTANGTAVTFPAATADWVPAVGVFWATAATAGNYLAWAAFSSQLQVNNTQQASFAASALTVVSD